MKRFLSLAMAAILSVSVLAGCGASKAPAEPAKSNENQTPAADTPASGADDSLKYIKDKGALVVGLDDAFPPMGFRDDKNEIVGFDIDVARAVCEKLGVKLELQPIDWDAKDQEMKTKRIDCIWNGFSINDERLKTYEMSKSYMDNHMALIVKSDSGIKSQADMAGKKMGIQSGSSADDALNDQSAAALKNSLAEVVPFKDNTTALMDLETNGVDAVLMDDVVANYFIKTNNKNYTVLSDFLYSEKYAVGFRKGELELTEAVNNALVELKKDGTLAKIATEWFGSDTTTVE